MERTEAIKEFDKKLAAHSFVRETREKVKKLAIQFSVSGIE